MRNSFLVCCVMLILITTTACHPSWRQTEGVQVLSATSIGWGFPTADVNRSRRIAIALPAGWYWVMRGDDMMATRDGVFLQNIFIERIHVDQITQSAGLFRGVAWSWTQWPLHTVKYLKKRFAEGMGSTEGADVILDSLANNPSVTDLQTHEVAPLQFAGNQGFRAVFDFRLNTPDDLSMLLGGAISVVDVSGRKTPYRSVYCGFMLGQWFYGISYTAAQRHYFQKDVETFESVLQSFQLMEK